MHATFRGNVRNDVMVVLENTQISLSSATYGIGSFAIAIGQSRPLLGQIGRPRRPPQRRALRSAKTHTE
jgi:hypothetical protein